MIRKSILFIATFFSIVLISLFVTIKTFRNVWCQSERFPGDFEIIGWTRAFYISDRIRSGECECISESLIIVKHPRDFTHEQIMEIKKALPIWSRANIPDFSDQDQRKLASTFGKLSDREFLAKLTYRYSFTPTIYYKEVPVYTIKVFHDFTFTTAYLPNYQDVHELFIENPNAADLNRNAIAPSTVFNNNGIPVYPIVESELWARGMFGEIGVIKWWWPYYLRRGYE